MTIEPDEFIRLRDVIRSAYPNPKSPVSILQSDRERMLGHLREGRISATARFRGLGLSLRLPVSYWDSVGADEMNQVLISSDDPDKQGDFEVTLRDALAGHNEEELARAASNIRVATGLASIGPLSALIRHADHVGHVGVLASEWAENSLNPQNQSDSGAPVRMTPERGKPTSKGWKIVFGELVRMIDNIQTETGKDIKSTLANELYSATLKRVALSSQRRQDVLSVKTLKEEISKALAEGPLPFMSENEAERLIR